MHIFTPTGEAPLGVMRSGRSFFVSHVPVTRHANTRQFHAVSRCLPLANTTQSYAAMVTCLSPSISITVDFC